MKNGDHDLVIQVEGFLFMWRFLCEDEFDGLPAGPIVLSILMILSIRDFHKKKMI